MSANVSMSQPSIVWNEKSILENGIPFIQAKNQELKLQKSLWLASVGNGPFSSLAIAASESFKESARNSIKQFEALDKSVTQLLRDDLEANPKSERLSQLKKVSLASRVAQSYFSVILKHKYTYPTLFNWGINKTFDLSAKVLLSTLGVHFAAMLIPSASQVVDPYLTLPLKASWACLVTAVSINAIDHYVINKKVETKGWKDRFDQVVYPNKAKKT